LSIKQNSAMKAILTRLVVVSLAVVGVVSLVGCGNKGPLVPPKADAATASFASATKALTSC
jgi:predicted small lipoprotein YifL